jgi:hypothetical protein
MATSYDPNKLGGYNWIFITTDNDKIDNDKIITDLTENRNFKKIYTDKKSNKTNYGAKGISQQQGNNIEVDYKTILKHNIMGGITDKDLNALMRSEPNDTAAPLTDTQLNEVDDTQLNEVNEILKEIEKLEGGKRKSKSRKNKSRKSKSHKSKSRKSKSHKSKSRKSKSHKK